MERGAGLPSDLNTELRYLFGFYFCRLLMTFRQGDNVRSAALGD